MIQRKSVINVELTPQELAFEFLNMIDDNQAIFFNELASLTEKWEYPFCFQLSSLIQNPILTEGGRRIMELIGEYGINE